MATSAIETAIVLHLPAEILGPGSAYETRRLALRKEMREIFAASGEITAIDSFEAKERVVQFGSLYQSAKKERVAFFKAIKVQIDDIKKPILAHEHDDVDPIESELLRLGTISAIWNAEEKRRKEEADRIAREEAQRQAREDLLARAVEAADEGDEEQAEAILEEPVFTAPVVTQVAPKTKGEVQRLNYSARVINLMELVKAVAAGKAPIGALMANESFIRREAVNYREGFSIPGCELVTTEKVSFKERR